MVKNQNGNNGRFLRISLATIVTVIVAVLSALFGYGISRIDKNTEKISNVQKNYVTKEDFDKRMDKIEQKLDKVLEDRR